VSGPIEDLDEQTALGTVAIWLTPENKKDEISASLTLLRLGGPKRYMRVWLSDGKMNWSWTIHSTAVLLWVMEGWEREVAAIDESRRR